MYKALTTLFLALAVALVGAYTVYGDGLFSFKTKAHAEAAIKESRSIMEAMDTYALSFGDGEVELGDPEQGEEVLKYLKHRELVLQKVGTESSSSTIESWVYDENTKQLMGKLSSANVCRYMNSMQQKVDENSIIPECGTAEASELSCCQDSTGSVGAVVPVAP